MRSNIHRHRGMSQNTVQKYQTITYS